MSFATNGVNKSSNRNSNNSSDFSSQAASSGNGISFGFLISVASLFLFTFAGLVAFNYFVMNRAPAPSSTNPLVAAIFDAEPTPQARIYETNGLVPFMVATKSHMLIAINRTEFGLDAIDSELHERCTKIISEVAADWSAERGKAIFDVKQGSEFLTCSMQHQTSRLCKPVYRKRLAARINEYLRAYRDKSALLKSLGTNPMAQNFKHFGKLGNPKKKGDRKFGQMSIPIIPAALGHEIKKLSAMGLIGTRDFKGWFSKTPEELIPYLSNVSSPC